ncbi:AIR synthase-related protein [Methanopyrus sp.]
MDLEGLAMHMMDLGASEDEIRELLADLVEIWKRDWSRDEIREFVDAVLDEVRYVRRAHSIDGGIGDILRPPESGVSMGEMGVGSRGEGDFFVHKLLTELAAEASENALISPEERDDAGAVRVDRDEVILVSAVDGMHSRLSEFPFLAGFHATRAAMRDVLVNGARPRGLLVDLHLADDGDVGRLFDFTAGVTAVGAATGVPILAGSTLRVGGDMVHGRRLVAGVACVGTARPDDLTPRRNAKPGDLIVLTEGAGGGTVSTTAIYHGYYDVVEETLNVDFVRAVNALRKEKLLSKVDAMTDITNGGIRGDAAEISETAGVRLVFNEEAIRSLVNDRVLEMLDELGVDYLGLSLDMLMVIAPEDVAERCVEVLDGAGVRADIVGRVEEGSGVFLERDGEEIELDVKFREAAYTKVKRVVGEEHPEDFEEMKERVKRAYEEAKRKLKLVLELLEESG